MSAAALPDSLPAHAEPRVFRWLLGFKLLYLAVALGAVLGWSSFDNKKFYAVNARWPREGGPVFASHLATWDGAHYLYLSEVGYKHEVPSCAFYPLWPLLVRGSAPLFGGSHLITSLVWANLLSLAAWVLFHRLVSQRWGKRTADWSLAFLIAFPGALFFQFNYTESLFLLLVLLLWQGLEEQRYGWAALAAGLLPLTRGVGAFAVLPIAWHVLQPIIPRRFRDDRREAEASSSSSVGVAESAGHWVFTRAWLLAMPLVGWAIYLALMNYWTGDPFEGFKAQRHWRVHSVSNLWNVPKFVVGLLNPFRWHGFQGSVVDRCVFLLLLNSLVLIWRLDKGKGLLVWTYMLGILPAMSGTFTSYTRFASCAFPMFIALGVFVSAECGVRSAECEREGDRALRRWPFRVGRRWLSWVLLAAFATLHVVLLWRFVNFRWAG